MALNGPDGKIHLFGYFPCVVSCLKISTYPELGRAHAWIYKGKGLDEFSIYFRKFQIETDPFVFIIHAL